MRSTYGHRNRTLTVQFIGSLNVCCNFDELLLIFSVLTRTLFSVTISQKKTTRQRSFTRSLGLVGVFFLGKMALKMYCNLLFVNLIFALFVFSCTGANGTFPPSIPSLLSGEVSGSCSVVREKANLHQRSCHLIHRYCCHLTTIVVKPLWALTQ